VKIAETNHSAHFLFGKEGFGFRTRVTFLKVFIYDLFPDNLLSMTCIPSYIVVHKIWCLMLFKVNFFFDKLTFKHFPMYTLFLPIIHPGSLPPPPLMYCDSDFAWQFGWTFTRVCLLALRTSVYCIFFLSYCWLIMEGDTDGGHHCWL
jgi:hypothetical protein